MHKSRTRQEQFAWHGNCSILTDVSNFLLAKSLGKGEMRFSDTVACNNAIKKKVDGMRFNGIPLLSSIPDGKVVALESVKYPGCNLGVEPDGSGTETHCLFVPYLYSVVSWTEYMSERIR